MDNDSISTYHRIMKSTVAEQILANCGIYIDLNVLKAHFISNNASKNSDIYRYMKMASQGGGYIFTEYHSKDITTARMFTKKGNLNLITLSDPTILSSMKSRYGDNGLVVVIDYKAFEPSIIKSLLGNCFPVDIHTWAEYILGLPRSEVKKMNMSLLYCDIFENKAEECFEELIGKSVDVDKCFKYINEFVEIRKAIENFVSKHIDVYLKSGYIVNSFGRKIYIKESRNIFSNMVQSIGSEILIESIVNIGDFIRDKEIHMLFHRFDSLYFDFSKECFLDNFQDITKIMELGAGGDTKLNVGIQLGNSLNSLKDFAID